METYAKGTRVPIERTRDEIERSLTKFGASKFAYAVEENRATIVFDAYERRVRFTLPLPTEGRRVDQDRRERWRALLLAIKSKLVSVESNIETFEEAFLSHIVMPNGETVGDHARPQLAALYSGKPMQSLLPAS